MKINKEVATIWIGVEAQNVFGLSLDIDGIKELMGTSKICP